MSDLPTPGLPQDEPAIDAFLMAFESGTLPGSAFTHAAHIFTGACYVHALGEPAALARMRNRIPAFNLAVGGQNTAISGYHETITVFWIKLLTGFRAAHPTIARALFAHNAVREFAPRRQILGEYYDYDVVSSLEARRSWIPPNLQPFD